MELCGEEEPASIPVNTMPINESAPNVEQSHIQWGLHDNKPKSQAVFEQAVESAANIIAEYHPYLPEPPEIMWAVEAANWQDGCQGKDYRPRIYDGESKRWILNDSGAMISVLPKKEYPEAKFDPDVTIEAVNKSKICTYGRKQIQIRIGRKVYNHEVIIADVSQPVLGWDFNRKFHLSLIWTDMGDLELHDRKAGTRSPMQVTANVHTVAESIRLQARDKRPATESTTHNRCAANGVQNFPTMVTGTENCCYKRRTSAQCSHTLQAAHK